MMITSLQMRQLERKAVQHGITYSELMENAGKEVYFAVKEQYDLTNKRVVVFCGSGNNGGDGFVAARYFSQHCPVIVLFFGSKEKLSEEAFEHYEQVKKRANVIVIKTREDLQKFHFQEHLSFIFIDALLGIGIKGVVEDPIAAGIDFFNSLKGIKVAIDVPSGRNPDTGEVQGIACSVDYIVTFHDLKQGLAQFQDKTVIVDIGIPE